MQSKKTAAVKTSNQYTLFDVNAIISEGFSITIPEDVLRNISHIASQLGLSTYVKPPQFHSKISSGAVGTAASSSTLKPRTQSSLSQTCEALSKDGFTPVLNKKQKHEEKVGKSGGGGSAPEISFSKNKAKPSGSWSTGIGGVGSGGSIFTDLSRPSGIRQTTKDSLTLHVDSIRTLLNKISAVTYEENKRQILEHLNDITKKTEATSLEEDALIEENLLKIAQIIFDIASNNRFYSELYSNLYSELIKEYDIMEIILKSNYDTFLDQFDTVEYVDSEKDYEKFCQINKDNEKRKSLGSFILNLTLVGVIPNRPYVKLILALIAKINELMVQENKTNEVNELVETVAVLYHKAEISKYKKANKLFMELDKLSTARQKQFPSLNNKSIFKLMDLLEK
jgi:hypothetical protein